MNTKAVRAKIVRRALELVRQMQEHGDLTNLQDQLEDMRRRLSEAQMLPVSASLDDPERFIKVALEQNPTLEEAIGLNPSIMMATTAETLGDLVGSLTPPYP